MSQWLTTASASEKAEYAAMYDQVRAEREASGKEDAPIMVAAEAMRRLRTAPPQK